ncbi:hypothetical protein RN001_004979 [Aquatica leii]|uniref:Uncharacterized protein n=1 Tax=Aquatica leii TaxID=1421715 RepID=A0AAN7Q698_9COLE|nr:hypothetical protein RN001_004979 [Aquatica leii]
MQITLNFIFFFKNRVTDELHQNSDIEKNRAKLNLTSNGKEFFFKYFEFKNATKLFDFENAKKDGEWKEYPVAMNKLIAFPVDAEKDLTTLENYIADKENLVNLASYLSTLGGRDVIGKVNNILKHCITNKLATFHM